MIKGGLRPKGIKRKGLSTAKIKPKTLLQRGKRKRRRKGEISKLKDKLWQLCRKIQIQKYGNVCYCCGADGLVGSNLHLGHFITSSLCSVEVRYSLDNLRPSCYRCNINLSGNWPAFERHLLKEGVEIELLKRCNEETKGTQYPQSWFENKITEYQSLLTT